jgi:hypothetical protein
MVYVHKVIDDEKDELLTVCDRQFLFAFLWQYCKDNDILFETMLSPSVDGKYLIYCGHQRDAYEVIEIDKGKRELLYTILVLQY